MINLLFNQKTPGKIGNLTLDVTISEQPTYTNDVTTFPIEDGGLISDGVVKQPLRLVLAGIVTNSPLWQGFGSGINSFKESFRSSPIGQVITRTGTRCDDALTALLRMTGCISPTGPGMRQSRKATVSPITIVTGLQVYNDMVVTSLVFDRDSTTGDALPFTLHLVQITKVTSSRIALVFPEAETDEKKKISSKVDTGKVTPAAEKPKVSILAGMFNRVAGGK